SWLPRAPNVIHIYPEWYGDLVVNVTATMNGDSVSTSLDLRIVRTVEDARLVMDPLMFPVCHGDQVNFTVLLLDWMDRPINEGTELSWRVDDGELHYTVD
ncbi:MAG: hypothetical protein GWN18_16575, partial [Thermoplasmata archaeon]|nr:hypothetical protein [Thermoplasmata archaeon]NIS13693.1 hypothetical protein [Thermoplasmata archaeon]NIS21564.1 hypothetical protein [Thermoplasmata archaeon]NIT79134.1 hypothetical protein [Thermoplasmata archaeon]NIU50603.1 hypothetical protein [Thermoplasmata archaeon]